VIEIPADELRAQYGAAVRPEELEESIEEPVRRRDGELREATIAVLAPVDAPADTDGDGSQGGESATDGQQSKRRRRRRGRRGGRRRRSGGGSGEAGG
jgi:ribonuclease E